MDDQPKNYLFKFLLYLDIFIGSLFARDPDVTISSYCGLALLSPSGSPALRVLGRALNWLVSNHCSMAIKNDIERAKEAIARLET